MDSLIKQLRVRFSGEEEESSDARERTPQRPQKTVSFKREKENKNRHERQLSGRMDNSDTFSDGEFATAIAAAAYAVTSSEGSPKRKLIQTSEKPATKKSVSRNEGTTPRKPPSGEAGRISNAGSDAGRLARWFSGKEPQDRSGLAGPVGDDIQQRATVGKQRMPDKRMDVTTSTKKTPTFSDKYLNETGIFKGPPPPKQQPTLATKPSAPVVTDSRKWKTETPLDHSKMTEADVWEKMHLDKIRKRYEKTNATITEWENQKKTKAERKLEKKERKLKLRQAAALQEYRNDVARISKIAGGARALADERKKNDEINVKEKAKEIRTKGVIPRTCFGF